MSGQAPRSGRARVIPAKWLSPASSEALQRAVEKCAWGRSRFKFACGYQCDEEAILLHGKPRDEGAGIWCDVRGPDGVEDHSGTFMGEC